jgi:hypothetical protein
LPDAGAAEDERAEDGARRSRGEQQADPGRVRSDLFGEWDGQSFRYDAEPG